MASSAPSRSFQSFAKALASSAAPRWLGVSSKRSMCSTQSPGSCRCFCTTSVFRSSSLHPKNLRAGRTGLARSNAVPSCGASGRSSAGAAVYRRVLFSPITANRTQSPYSGISRSPSMAPCVGASYSAVEPVRCTSE